MGWPYNDNQVFLGYSVNELTELEKYKRPTESIQPGFHIDCFGIKTRYSYFFDTDAATIQADLPVPDNGLYGEAVEFLATCRAVDAASTSMTVIELGAGFAPWLVCAAAMALQRPIEKLRLIAVEADPARLELIRSHFADNGLPEPGRRHARVETEIIHAAISDTHGTVSFAAQDIRDWGGGVSEEPAAQDYRGLGLKYVSVPTYPLSHLLASERFVDLIHMDIQGFEYKSIAASLADLNCKVRSIAIGTHSRVIEGRLIGLLREQGWTLVYEKPCKFHPSSQLPDITGATYFDGTQFWINNRLWPKDFAWTPMAN
jgi:FkbM family methyltransferase